MADPVARRVTALMRELADMFARSGKRDFLARQLGIIMEALCEEIEDDPHLIGSQMGQAYLIMFGKLMEWTATGDTSNLPEQLMPIVENMEKKQLAHS